MQGSYRNGVAHFSRLVNINIARLMELVNPADLSLTKYTRETCG